MFSSFNWRILTRHRYLGGYIRDKEAERVWLRDKIQGWTESVKIIARVAQKHPQSAYTVLQKSLQQEWVFMQRVTPGVGDTFGPVEVARKDIFVPMLYHCLREGVPERGITRLPFKQAGLALPDPTQTDPENWTASCVITGKLVAALRGQVEFWRADHSACLWEGRTAVRRRGQIQAEEDLTAALEGAPVFHARQLQQAAKTRAWITVLPSTVNRTELGSQECRDALFLLYGLDPPDLLKYCDRC